MIWDQTPHIKTWINHTVTLNYKSVLQWVTEVSEVPCDNIHNSFKDSNAWLRPNQTHCNKIQATINLSVHTRCILAMQWNKINQQSITANQKSTWAGSLQADYTFNKWEWALWLWPINECLIPSLVWKFMFPLI